MTKAEASQAEEIRRLRDNLQGEIDGAAVYDALAQSEPDARVAAVYRELARTERRHAAYWAERLGRARGGKVAAPDPAPSWRARAMAWASRRFGPSAVLPALSATERRDSRNYDNQPDAVAGGFHRDERMHARVVQAAASRNGGLPGETLAMIEGRHRGGGGNALRAAVLGANDGLVSNLSLVMGVAGAAAGGRTILLTGLAGLVAGACSMAMGEWLSVNSSRELYERQIATERAELEQSPEEEKEELVLIYQAKGLAEAQARSLAEELLSNKASALDTLVREELGIDPDELGGSPWAAAAASFGLFAVGAIFPVAPFFFLRGQSAVFAALALSGLALVAIGLGTSLFTGRGAVFSATRQLAIGLAAAGVTFGVGKLVGVSLS